MSDSPGPADSPGPPDSPGPAGEPPPAVTDPAKLIRLGTMLQALMVEVRSADTDPESRKLLARIHNETMDELATVLSDDLMEELTEFTSCCDSDGIPTESEIRVAQAQLVGWLQGLLQGMQASMAAQQAAAAMQLRELASTRQTQGVGGDGTGGAGPYL